MSNIQERLEAAVAILNDRSSKFKKLISPDVTLTAEDEEKLNILIQRENTFGKRQEEINHQMEQISKKLESACSDKKCKRLLRRWEKLKPKVMECQAEGLEILVDCDEIMARYARGEQ